MSSAAAYDEGVIKFSAEHTDAALPEFAHERANELAAWRRVCIRLGVIGREHSRYGGAGYGNMSARIPPYPGGRSARRFVITGSQTSVSDEYVPAGLAVVEAYDAGANWVRSVGPVKPSSESMTHGAIYDLSPAIRWVFHGHIPEVWRQARRMRLPCTSPEVPYGTPEMAAEMARLYRDTNLAESRVLAMLGHEDGIMTFGRTASEAGEVSAKVLARAFAVESEP